MCRDESKRGLKPAPFRTVLIITGLVGQAFYTEVARISCSVLPNIQNPITSLSCGSL